MTGGDLKYDAVVDGVCRFKMRAVDGDELGGEPEEAPGGGNFGSLTVIEEAFAALDGENTYEPEELTEDGAREVLTTLIKVNKPVNTSHWPRGK